MNPIPKPEYIKHRLERAKETLAEAHMLFDGNHLSGAVKVNISNYSNLIISFMITRRDTE